MTFAALCWAALATAVVHTAVGPDHYLPFIALGKARGWTLGRTTIITIIAGIAHVASSVLIGLVGLYLSIQLHLLEKLEAIRGDFVAWFLVIFGAGYLIWGLYKVKHHDHKELKLTKAGMIGWILFIIFAFGPCEPLIPLFMFPAASFGMLQAILIGVVFLIGTVATMLVIVLAGVYGLSFIPARLHGYGHALAGVVVTLSGLLVVMGL